MPGAVEKTLHSPVDGSRRKTFGGEIIQNLKVNVVRAGSVSYPAKADFLALCNAAVRMFQPLGRAASNDRARDIAEAFYTGALVNGTPLGEVLRNVRRGWRDGQHLTYLAYVLYGDPMSRVTYARTHRVSAAPPDA